MNLLRPLGMNRSDITNLYVKNVHSAAFVPGESAHLLLNQVGHSSTRCHAMGTAKDHTVFKCDGLT